MSPIIGTPTHYEIRETERKLRDNLTAKYGRRSRVNAGQIRTRIQQLYQNGMTQQRIAELLNIKRDLVHYYLSRSKA
jgi:hypothetical protein